MRGLVRAKVRWRRQTTSYATLPSKNALRFGALLFLVVIVALQFDMRTLLLPFLLLLFLVSNSKEEGGEPCGQRGLGESTRRRKSS